MSFHFVLNRPHIILSVDRLSLANFSNSVSIHSVRMLILSSFLVYTHSLSYPHYMVSILCLSFSIHQTFIGSFMKYSVIYHTRQVLWFEQTIMYEILVAEPLRTSECAGESRFSADLCKRALDVTADVIVEATRDADILTINASEDFQ